jgi:hypothetical protein
MQVGSSCTAAATLLSWLAGYLFHLLSFFVSSYLALLLSCERKTDDSENKWRRMVREPVFWLTGLILFRLLLDAYPTVRITKEIMKGCE